MPGAFVLGASTATIPSSDSSSTDGALPLPLSLRGLFGCSAVAHSAASLFAMASSLSLLVPLTCFVVESPASSSSESPMLITLCSRSRLAPVGFGFEGEVKNVSMDD